jgi:hypothetical protein
MPKIAASLLLTGLLAATAASAQTPVQLASRSMLPKTHDACAIEAQTYCSAAPQTPGGIRQCLALHADHLSPTCKSSMNQMRNWNQFHPKMGH